MRSLRDEDLYGAGSRLSEQSDKEAYQELERALRKIGAPEEDEATVKLIEREIEQQGSHDLNTWAAAGMNRGVLLKLLASIASASTDANWYLEEMRNRQAALKSLAKRMKTLARDAQKLIDDPFSKIQAWAYLHGGGFAIGGRWPPMQWKDIAGVPQIPSSMNSLAGMLADEERTFGRYLRALGRTDSLVVQLLVNCWASRARKMQAGADLFRLDHVDELARLLTDAFEAAGKSDKFTADQLRKIWSRHGKRMLAIWLRLQTEPVHEKPPLGLSPKLDSKPQD